MLRGSTRVHELVPCLVVLGSFFRVVGSNPTVEAFFNFTFKASAAGFGQCFSCRKHGSRCIVQWQHFQPRIPRSRVRFPTVALLDFWFSYLPFAFHREVAHLTWPRPFGPDWCGWGVFEFTTFFTIWFFPTRKE